MCQFFVVSDVRDETPFVTLFHIAHIVFIAGITRTEEHKLQCFVFHNVFKLFHHKLETLLLRHTRNHGENRQVTANLKAEPFLQSSFTCCLPAAIFS